MKKIFKSILLASVMLLSTQNLFGDEQLKLKEHFLKKIDEVVLVVQNSKLDKPQRNDKIITILDKTFDFELMAKLSLGKVWKKLSKDDKKRFVVLYVKRMEQSYSSKLDSYNGEEVEVTRIKQPKNNRIALITNLVNDAQKLEVVYKFYKPKKKIPNKDNWLVYDAEISGVSILKTDKAQFREFLKTKTLPELMEVLGKS